MLEKHTVRLCSGRAVQQQFNDKQEYSTSSRVVQWNSGTVEYGTVHGATMICQFRAKNHKCCFLHCASMIGITNCQCMKNDDFAA